MALHTLPFALIYDDLLSDAGRIEGGLKDAAELVSKELCRDEKCVTTIIVEHQSLAGDNIPTPLGVHGRHARREERNVITERSEKP